MRRRAAAFVAVALLTASCSSASDSASSAGGSTTSIDLSTVAAVSEPPDVTLAPVDTVPERGGTVVVGLWAEPDPGARHLGGAIVRSLVHPQLFTARPDGGWAPRLVEPGSVVEAPDLRSVRFRLRAEAMWSDGTPITADDLARSADDRFVSSIGEDGVGAVTVEFTQPLPGWRRLWSGVDSVVPARDDVWGGPFAIAEIVPGLETVLVPNETWWGRAEGPFLDELRLVVVPDQTTLMQLFEAGELDVVAPWAASGRTIDAERAATGGVAVADGFGWAAVARAQPTLDLGARRSVLSGFEPGPFVGALLKGEATMLESGGWIERPVEDLDDAVAISVSDDLPMVGVLARSVQLAAADAGARVPELRTGPYDVVAGWERNGDYEVLLTTEYLGPSPCYRCRYESLAPNEAALADAGTPEPLFTRLADEALVRPLWMPERVAAWHDGVAGVEANGWALFVTWNAWRWSSSEPADR